MPDLLEKWEEESGVFTYQLEVKLMKTRWGANIKKNGLTPRRRKNTTLSGIYHCSWATIFWKGVIMRILSNWWTVHASMEKIQKKNWTDCLQVMPGGMINERGRVCLKDRWFYDGKSEKWRGNRAFKLNAWGNYKYAFLSRLYCHYQGRINMKFSEKQINFLKAWRTMGIKEVKTLPDVKTITGAWWLLLSYYQLHSFILLWR